MDHDPYGIGLGMVVLPMPLVFIAIHAIAYFFSGLSDVPARRLLARNTLKYNIVMWAVLVIAVLSFNFIIG